MLCYLVVFTASTRLNSMTSMTHCRCYEPRTVQVPCTFKFCCDNAQPLGESDDIRLCAGKSCSSTLLPLLTAWAPAAWAFASYKMHILTSLSICDKHIAIQKRCGESMA